MSRFRFVPLFTLFTTLSLISYSAHAEKKKTPAVKPLSIDWIMRGPELYGTEPTDVRWSLDSKRVYFRWKEPGEARREPTHWYVFDTTTPPNTKPHRLSDDEADDVPPPFSYGAQNCLLGADGKFVMVYERNGDIYTIDEDDAKPKAWINTPSQVESDPVFNGNYADIIYRVGDNFFHQFNEKETKITEQLTDIRIGSPPKEDPKKKEGVGTINETIEKELFDTVRARDDQRQKSIGTRQERENKKTRKTFYLEGDIVTDLQISPKYNKQAPKGTIFSQSVLVGLTKPETADNPKASVVPQYINDDGFVAAPKGRPNVGWEKRRASRYVLLDVPSGKATPISLPAPIQGKDVWFSGAKFDQYNGLLALMVVSTDWHNRWIVVVNSWNNDINIVDSIHDDAWIDGPGWDSFGWLPSGDLYSVSEVGGWSHLVVHRSGMNSLAVSGPTATYSTEEIAKGKWEISDPIVWEDAPQRRHDWTGNGTVGLFLPDHSRLYFSSSEGDLSQRHTYRYDFATGKRVNLTRSLPGWNEGTISPDGESLAVIHSYTNKPPELYVMAAKPDAVPRQITLSPTPEFLAYLWRDVPVVQIPARDGTPVYARLFTSSKRTPESGAAVVFVHGAGYLQNADKGWTEYPREYMFHHFLAEHGYTVLDVDYRGSSGYGRDFRTGIYKHMGGKDLSDVTDAVRWLVKNQKVNPKRVGIYGGSYGGFLTLMALFTEPTVYRAGAALRPVTDWTKYNDWYTSRILGLPQDDLTAYKRSSPIFFAEGLTGSLLICHGMRDDNVFFQDSVRLTERLIELGKTDHFQTAIYPVESHGFTEPASWSDEYKRIFTLFESTIGSAK